MPFPQCPTCGREPLSYDELCEHPQPIDAALLTASNNALELLRVELMAEHFQTCEGFVLVDAGMDSEKKVPCDICWPEETTHERAVRATNERGA